MSDWNFDVSKAPRNGTLLLLLVDYTASKDADFPLQNEAVAGTIGWNNFDNDGENVWKFAGWNWDSDCFVGDGGVGQVLAWMPFPLPQLWCMHVQGPDDLVPCASKEAAEVEAEALNEAWRGRKDQSDNDPIVRAFAKPWPFASYAHAVFFALRSKPGADYPLPVES